MNGMAEAPVTIRVAKPRDAKAIVSVMQKAYAQYKNRIEPPLQALTVGTSDVAAEIRVPGRGYLVAVTDDRIVGCVRYRLLRGRGGRMLELSRLAVDPAYRGCGTGSALMAAGEDIARRAGVRELRGNVRVAMSSLLDYYGRMGWQVLGYRSKPGYPRYLLVVGKQLASDKEG